MIPWKMTVTISQNNAPFSKTFSARSREFPNTSNHSVLNTRGLVVLLLVKRQRRKVTVFYDQLQNSAQNYSFQYVHLSMTIMQRCLVLPYCFTRNREKALVFPYIWKNPDSSENSSWNGPSVLMGFSLNLWLWQYELHHCGPWSTWTSFTFSSPSKTDMYPRHSGN